jgi:F-type H+-transporting ATPase subunit alpha
MKKVAGTLKLDQAQFRELEAFAKFGSDLDASTKLTIERGRRNLEILKQAPFSPVTVEEQVATIYVSTMGAIDNVAVSKVRDFEKEFLATLKASHKDTLKDIKSGKIDESVTEVLKKVAKEIAPKHN